MLLLSFCLLITDVYDENSFHCRKELLEHYVEMCLILIYAHSRIHRAKKGGVGKTS